MRSLRFVPYHLLGETPNVIVDGSPTDSTVVTLSHWPGSPTPPELLDDLSAQIAFHALDRDAIPAVVTAVSNNHLDQDGLMSAFALVDPEAAIARRERVVDIASAGDFAVYADRDSMRVSMAIAAMSEPETSPFEPAVFDGGYMEQTGRLYERLLADVVPLIDDVERTRPLWEREDAHLTESLAAIDAGVVTLEEDPALDLAVVTIPDSWAERVTSRFTVQRSDALHPAAVPARSRCMRVLTIHGADVRIECRYETWVMFRSRPLLPRPDLRLLAARLNDLGDPGWHADAPGSLTPRLSRTDGTTLSPATILTTVRAFLATAEPAWDPFAPR